VRLPCSYHPGSPHDMQLDWAMITRSKQWAQASAQEKAALAENHTVPGSVSAWDKGWVPGHTGTVHASACVPGAITYYGGGAAAGWCASGGCSVLYYTVHYQVALICRYHQSQSSPHTQHIRIAVPLFTWPCMPLSANQHHVWSCWQTRCMLLLRACRTWLHRGVLGLKLDWKILEPLVQQAVATVSAGGRVM
jgi:hypothetical protein